MSFLDLLHEHILLVEEKHNGRGGEVAVVADTVEQVETLMHSVLWGQKRVSATEMLHNNTKDVLHSRPN